MKSLNVQRVAIPMDAILENPLPFDELINSPVYFEDKPKVPKCDHIIL